MALSFTFQATPRSVAVGSPMAFSGNVSDNGDPYQNLTIFLRDEHDNPLTDSSGAGVGGQTDGFGDYYLEWFPSETWKGKHSVRAMVVIMDQLYSAPVDISVGAGMAFNPLLLLGLLGIVYFLRKRG